MGSEDIEKKYKARIAKKQIKPKQLKKSRNWMLTEDLNLLFV